MEVGEYRLIPKETEFWSIPHQTMIKMVDDLIIKIKCTVSGSDYIFAEPQQLLFEYMIPCLIGKGSGEIEISYSKTLPYKLPEPNILVFNYNTNG